MIDVVAAQQAGAASMCGCTSETSTSRGGFGASRRQAEKGR